MSSDLSVLNGELLRPAHDSRPDAGVNIQAEFDTSGGLDVSHLIVAHLAISTTLEAPTLPDSEVKASSVGSVPEDFLEVLQNSTIRNDGETTVMFAGRFSNILSINQPPAYRGSGGARRRERERLMRIKDEEKRKKNRK
jgi:hypothetical protein